MAKLCVNDQQRNQLNTSDFVANTAELRNIWYMSRRKHNQTSSKILTIKLNVKYFYTTRN